MSLKAVSLKALSPGWHEWAQETEGTGGSCTHWCWGSGDKRGDRGRTAGHGTRGLGSAEGSCGEMVERQRLHHQLLPGQPQSPALTRVDVITAGLGLGLGLVLELVLSESSSLLGQPNDGLAHGHRPHTSTPNIPSALCPTHRPFKHPSSLPHIPAPDHSLLCPTLWSWSIPCSAPCSASPLHCLGATNPPSSPVSTE